MSMKRFLMPGVLVTALIGLVLSVVNAQEARRKKMSARDTAVITRSPAGNSPASGRADAKVEVANRMRVFKRMVDQGVVPINDLTSSIKPVVTKDEPPTKVDTRIVVSSDAAGDVLVLQTAFAEKFAKHDPLPSNRSRHFDWLPPNDQVRHIGWSGVVLAVQSERDGTSLVKIRVYPWLFSKVLKTLVVDYVEEVYRFGPNLLQLVDSDADLPKPKLQVFPVH